MNKEELIGKLQMVYVGDKNALNELIGYYDGLKEVIEILQQQNQKYKEVIDKLRKICSKVPYDWSICGIDVVHKIENILKEVE